MTRYEDKISFKGIWALMNYGIKWKRHGKVYWAYNERLWEDFLIFLINIHIHMLHGIKIGPNSGWGQNWRNWRKEENPLIGKIIITYLGINISAYESGKIYSW